MMTKNKLRLVTIKFIVAAACVGAGAAAVVQKTEQPAENVPIVLADSLPAPQADAGLKAQYQTCRHVLQTMIDAYDRGDAAAVKSQIYLGPDANPQLTKIVPLLVDIDLAVYRLQKDAVARFGAGAMGLNTYWTPSAVGIRELMARIDAKDCRLMGNEFAVTPAAPVYSSDGVWPRPALFPQH